MSANKKSSPMQTERDAANKMEFDGALMNATQWQAHVFLKAGDQTDAIAAHKLILMVQHVRVLYLAADKYEIPHLQDLCRNQLSGTRNVFDVLDLAKIHHDNILEHEVSKFIASHMEGVSSSSKFMSFVESDPALTVQAIRGHVARSKVFIRNILESDDFKASLSKETITLSEMKHDELETFLEFIYNGSLSDTKMMQHVHVLYLAADKYEIPHLQDLCRNQLIGSKNITNVLFDVLELARFIRTRSSNMKSLSLSYHTWRGFHSRASSCRLWKVIRLLQSK
ncbi:unnamed protein product [Brassica napus]|uniref:(rape) hypothetical protein n=1 Tax=Brassica napus TaxID=3708 RepID=A0A817B768_BRANA|nr:unnamed protein product [Brassica napus]